MKINKTPSTVLTLFPSPTGYYMGHFFHFKDDVPKETTISKKRHSGENIEKVIYETKKQKMFVSDIDTIVKKHEHNKGKHSYAEIALGVFSNELLDQLEETHLDLDDVIKWAKEEASNKITPASKKAKEKALKADDEVKILYKLLVTVAPNATPEELRSKLVELVGKTEKLDQAVSILNKKLDKFNSDPRDSKGYIRLNAKKSK